MTRAGTLILATALLSTLSGCRGTPKSGDEKRDPLYGRYIPKTDLPVPGRDGRRDPLFTAPTSGSKKSDEPFRPTSRTSIAGIAGNVQVEDTGMSLGDRRPAAEPMTRGTPLRPREAMTQDGWQDVAEELSRLKARYEAPHRDTHGDFTMTASIPVGNDGAVRKYEASGRTAAEAAKALVEQIPNRD